MCIYIFIYIYTHTCTYIHFFSEQRTRRILSVFDRNSLNPPYVYQPNGTRPSGLLIHYTWKARPDQPGQYTHFLNL